MGRTTQGPITSRVGQRIRDLRVGQGLSQRELGRRAGRSRTQIAAIERGEKAPTIVTLDVVAKALSVSIASLLAETHPDDRQDRAARLAAKLRERPAEYVEILEAALKGLDRAADLARRSRA